MPDAFRFERIKAVLEKQKSILIYRLGSLGDTIVALPCFNLIRRAFPGARFTLLTNIPVGAKAAPIETILGPNFFSEVLDYPLGLRDPYAIWTMLRTLRKGRYDVVIHLTAFRGRKQSIRDWIFFHLAGIPKIVGLAWNANDAPIASQLFRGTVEVEYCRLAKRISTLGDARVDEDEAWNLALTDEEMAVADSLLDNSKNLPVVAMSCGTKWRTNDWEEERWNALVTRLSVKFPNALLVLLGAEEERARADRMARHWPGQRRNLCGRSTPRVSAAILKRSHLFVGHDSGPLHLAACVGVPCIGIFSARNAPGRWFPRGKRTRVIYHQTNCFGCGLENCEAEAKKCIRGITVAEVEAAIDEVFFSDGKISALTDIQ